MLAIIRPIGRKDRSPPASRVTRAGATHMGCLAQRPVAFPSL